MNNPFKVGQSVKTKYVIDYTLTSGPYIEQGTTATVLHLRGGKLMWVEFNEKSGYGRRCEAVCDFEAYYTPYELAVKEVAEGIQDAINNDGHEYEDAIGSMMKGFESDVRDYLAEHKK